MDPKSGELFGPLPTSKDARAGDTMTADVLVELREKMDEELAAKVDGAEVDRALEHLNAGGRLVAVDGDAVQRLRLGDRELRRRRQRR